MNRPASSPPAATNRQHLGQTLKHGVIYGLGTMLSRLVGFVMIPIYTRLLTPQDYGVLELLGMTTSVLAMLAGVGLTMAVTRYYYVYDEAADKRAVVSSAVILQVLLFGLATSISLPLAGHIASLLLGDAAFAGFVRLSLIGFFLSSWMEIPLVLLRARQRSTTVVMLGVVQLALALSLNILFVVVLRLGVVGVLYSTIIASGTMGTVLVSTTLYKNGIRLDTAITRRLVRYGAPLIVASVGTFIVHFSDRFLLRTYASLDDVGLYSLGYRFAMLLSVFVATPFSMIWTPKALELHTTQGDAAKPIFRDILSWYLIVLVSSGVAIALFTSDVIRLVAGERFQAASGPVPLLCLAMVFYGYRQVARLGSWLTKHSSLVATSTAVAAVVVIVANVALIPVWGVMGAATATFLAFATEFAVMLGRSARVYALNYPLPRLLAPVLIGIATYAVTQVAIPANTGLVVSLSAKTLAVLIAASFMVLAREGNLDLLKSAVRRVRRIQEPRAGDGVDV